MLSSGQVYLQGLVVIARGIVQIGIQPAGGLPPGPAACRCRWNPGRWAPCLSRYAESRFPAAPRRERFHPPRRYGSWTIPCLPEDSSAARCCTDRRWPRRIGRSHTPPRLSASLRQGGRRGSPAWSHSPNERTGRRPPRASHRRPGHRRCGFPDRRGRNRQRCSPGRRRALPGHRTPPPSRRRAGWPVTAEWPSRSQSLYVRTVSCS